MNKQLVHVVKSSGLVSFCVYETYPMESITTETQVNDFMQEAEKTVPNGHRQLLFLINLFISLLKKNKLKKKSRDTI